ncbi:MAG: hypothetical protein K2P78_14560 [Gemmataceae bacterium]|nr:hypothetical protein [Gemmataceae bacterium]
MPTSEAELCPLCRVRTPPEGRSVCERCLPPNPARTLADELSECHAACMEHVRVRNELGERLERWRNEVRLARDLIRTGNVIAGVRRLELLLGES